MLTRRQLLQTALIAGAGLTLDAPSRALGLLPGGVTASDVVVLGATPGGLCAAIAAARLGCHVIVIERLSHIGGLPANGLGITDIATVGATGGLFLEFAAGVKNYYVNRYGPASAQVKACANGYNFEPHVAEAVFEAMIAAEPNIIIVRNRQFDSSSSNVRLTGSRLTSLTVTNRANNARETYNASVFIDATYEGDLAAAAGAPFETRRESTSEYREPYAGKVYHPFGSGPAEQGSTGVGDTTIQAYNYRLCMSANRNNRIPIEKPASYNRGDYTAIIPDIQSGRILVFASNARAAAILPGLLPNTKFDVNNHAMSLVSTDLPEENWQYPRANWAWRDSYAARLRSYTQGFFWFCQNDATLPSTFRQMAQAWGYAADEYMDDGYFPRQLYVREGRRITGDYKFTALDTIAPSDAANGRAIIDGLSPPAGDVRPPIHSNSITASHYPVDSHAVRKLETGRQHLDGALNYQKLSKPFQVPFGVIVPKIVEYLLTPVPVSATHLGFGSLRLEPCWMSLGHAAGVAAYLSIAGNIPPRNVSVQRMQQILLAQGATLTYINDTPRTHRHYAGLQIAGCHGCLPGFSALPDQPIDRATALDWASKAGGSPKLLPATTMTRGEYATMLFT